MKQRKILNKQTAVRPLAKESGLIDPENRKQAYVCPQVSVVYVELESTIASSISGGSTPTVDDWDPVDPGTGDSGDLSL
jgi:hypothetical protein